MGNGWTPQRRARQAALIKTWKPWQQATGPMTEAGKARVIVLVEEDGDDAQWRKAAYERFMSEDSPEDAVYDKYAR